MELCRARTTSSRAAGTFPVACSLLVANRLSCEQVRNGFCVQQELVLVLIFHCSLAGVIFLPPVSLVFSVLAQFSAQAPDGSLPERQRKCSALYMAPCECLVGWEEGPGMPKWLWEAHCGTFPITCMARKRRLAFYCEDDISPCLLMLPVLTLCFCTIIF